MSHSYGNQHESEIIYSDLRQSTLSIVYPGQLVRIKRDYLETMGQIGIIIECLSPHFGYMGSERWLVFIDGRLLSIESFQIYTV